MLQMSSEQDLKEHSVKGHEQSNVQHAAEAFRIASQTAKQQQEELHHNNQTEHTNRQHSINDRELQANTIPDLHEYDLKSKDSKYKRWSPRMDQLLIKLLSDVVHSYPKGTEPEMTKKAWAYVTGQLRAINPETVYSTYTKYSCQQHLYNVNHHRYKIWYILMIHSKNHGGEGEYSYKWSPESGRFQIVLNTTGNVIIDERQVKTLLYSDSLSLPSLNSFNKGNLILNDFFLTDHLRYMSAYHNEVLPLLIKLDSRYAEGLGDIYGEIPKFEFHDSSTDFYRPLVPAKLSKLSVRDAKERKRNHRESSPSDPANDVPLFSAAMQQLPQDEMVEEDSVDPALKRSRTSNTTEQNSSTTSDIESVLATAAIAAINSPSVTNGRDLQPIYIKDKKWFNKLLNLHDLGHLTSSEVLAICEGVRDGKVPLFMLNILDQGYYPTRNLEIASEENSNEETAKKVREFIIPMTFHA